MPTNKPTKAPTDEPLVISPRRAAELADVSLATMFEWIKDELVASTLVRGSRRIDYKSFKRRVAPDKVRQVRRGVHNPSPAKTLEG